MYCKIVFRAALFTLLLQVGAASAYDLPEVACTLDENKSRMQALASISGSSTWDCLVECRIKVDGERALNRHNCRFVLVGGQPEKMVCAVEGDGPGYFSEVITGPYQCAPR